MAIVIAGNLVSMFFFMPETKYTGIRPSILPPDSPSNLEKTNVDKVEHTATEQDVSNNEEILEQVANRGYMKSLTFWGHGDPDVDLKKAFLRPFVLLAYPTILWSCLIYGMALGWNVVLGASTAQLFAPP